MGQMSSAMFKSDQRAPECIMDVMVGLLVSSSELTMNLGARLYSQQSLVTGTPKMVLFCIGKQILTARWRLAKLSFSVMSQCCGGCNAPVLFVLGSPMENLRDGRGWPVLRLMENLRFTKAPTCAMALDMMGGYRCRCRCGVPWAGTQTAVISNDSGDSTWFCLRVDAHKYFAANRQDELSRGHDAVVWGGGHADAAQLFVLVPLLRAFTNNSPTGNSYIIIYHGKRKVPLAPFISSFNPTLGTVTPKESVRIDNK